MMRFGSTAVMAGGQRGIGVVVCASILICISYKLRLPVFLVRPMDYLGRLSYPLYLTHLSTIFFVYNLHPFQIPIIYVIMLVSIVVFHAIEMPAKSLKRYILK